MDRKKFLRKSLLGAAVITASASGLQAAASAPPRSTYDKLMERMNFGVLNDDYVAPGRGFGTHPHDNMEIVSSKAADFQFVKTL